MLLRPVAVLTTAVLAVITACAAPPPPAAAQPGLVWAPCGDGAVQCATVPVPVDHGRPGGEHIGIAIARLPAEDPATRRGTLVLHTGGPAPALRALLDPGPRAAFAELTRWFDLVTFDSRGYGLSNPVCDPALAPPVAVLDSAPSYEQHRQHLTAYAGSCREDHATLLEHASAEDTAHDIDAIRAALGEERILFYGNSYGTAFGQEYAEHHGHRLSRLYLDSVVDRTSTPLADETSRATTRDHLLARFGQRCAADPSCPVADEDPLAVWDAVVATAERQPLPAGPGRALSASEIRMMSPFLAEMAYEPFAAALAAARGGDGAPLAALVPAGQPPADGGQLTTCLDVPRPDEYAQLRAMAEQVAEQAPRTGPALSTEDWRCAGWPVEATNPPAPLAAPDAPPALVVNVTLDPATHLAGARRVADQIAGSRVLPVTGYSHAVYWGQPDNRCVRDAVHRYLLDGVLPEAGAECPSLHTPTLPR